MRRAPILHETLEHTTGIGSRCAMTMTTIIIIDAHVCTKKKTTVMFLKSRRCRFGKQLPYERVMRKKTIGRLLLDPHTYTYGIVPCNKPLVSDCVSSTMGIFGTRVNRQTYTRSYRVRHSPPLVKIRPLSPTREHE